MLRDSAAVHAGTAISPRYVKSTMKFNTSSVLVRLRKKSTEAGPKACFDDGVVNGYLVTVSYSKFTAGFSIFSIFLYFFKK